MSLDVEKWKTERPPKDETGYKASRAHLRLNGGEAALLSYLEGQDFVANGKLTTGTKPYNVFARVASGVMTQPDMDEENAALGDAGKRFMLASNLPEADEKWESTETQWLGRASMSKRHRFLTTRDLSWRWFNVLTFGGTDNVIALRDAIETLEAMVRCARLMGLYKLPAIP